jgi:hypothetical protein
MAKRILKSYEDVTLTEVTLPSDQGIVSRAYSVRTADPTETRQFGDMGSAETYFEEQVLKRSNAKL